MSICLKALALFLGLICFSSGCTYDVEHVYASENCKTDFFGFPDIPDWRFTDMTLLEDTSNITDFFFIKEGKGLLCTNKDIWLTKDDGAHWEKVFSGTPLYVYTVCFSDDLHGFVTGSLEEKYCILRTKDGGHTWTTLYLNEDWIFRFSFADSLNGVATFYHWSPDPYAGGAYYAKSRDGGESWEEMSDLSASPTPTITMKMCANGFGYLPGRKGEIHITNDFGGTWETIYTDFDYSIIYVQFLDANIGFVGDLKSLYKTTDGGNSWVQISDNRPNWFYFFSATEGVSLQTTEMDFDFDQDEFIYCRAFLSTFDGGITWTEGPPSVNFEMSNIQFIHDRLGFARSSDPEHKFVKLYR